MSWDKQGDCESSDLHLIVSLLTSDSHGLQALLSRNAVPPSLSSADVSTWPFQPYLRANIIHHVIARHLHQGLCRILVNRGEILALLGSHSYT